MYGLLERTQCKTPLHRKVKEEELSIENSDFLNTPACKNRRLTNRGHYSLTKTSHKNVAEHVPNDITRVSKGE